MARETLHRLGDLQLRILQALWEAGEATVAEDNDAVGPDLAYTTVATMLRKMEERRLVTHREHGRRFIYRAAVAEEQVTHGMADRLVDRLFRGSISGAVSHLLEPRDVNPSELDRLEELIEDYRKRRRQKAPRQASRKSRRRK